MKARIQPTPLQKKRIDNAIKEHNTLKKISALLKDYRGNDFRILKIKEVTNKKLNRNEQ